MDLVSDELGVRLEHVLRAAPVGIIVFDRTGRILWVNETVAAANGRAADDHRGLTIAEAAGHLADTHEPILRAVLDTGTARTIVSTALVPGDTVERSAAEHFFAIRDDAGAVVGAANVWWEITDVLAEARRAGQDAEAERAAREAAEATRDRVRFLADASARISESLDEAAILDRLVRLAVPELADWAAVYIPRAAMLHRVAVVHATGPGGEGVVAMPPVPPLPIVGDAPAAVAFRTREVQLITRPEPSRLHANAPEQMVEVFRRLDLRSGMAIPIVSVEGQALGVIAFAASGARGVPGVLDIALATELAARAGVALDHARRFDRERAVADALQRAVLPTSLPPVAGLAAAARFVPSSARADVGGDWFDLVPVGDRVLLAVGDVVGHGLTAAASMAQMRSAFRAYALEGHPPAVIARLLGGFVEDDDVFVTALVAELDPASGTLQFVNAGHPPPVVIAHEARLLEGSDVPIGIARGTGQFTTRTTALAPGETLLLYTDGLVERRGEAIDESISRVVASSPALASDGVDALLDALVAKAGTATEDDVCLLAVRRLPGA